MSVINPQEGEYDTPDGLKVAKDIAWVMRTLWGGAVVFVLAVVWVVSLANEVQHTKEIAEAAATKNQMTSVIESLNEIKRSLGNSDTRERDMKEKIDTLAADVKNLKERD